MVKGVSEMMYYECEKVRYERVCHERMCQPTRSKESDFHPVHRYDRVYYGREWVFIL